jgi:hypothetical protein
MLAAVEQLGQLRGIQGSASGKAGALDHGDIGRPLHLFGREITEPSALPEDTLDHGERSSRSPRLSSRGAERLRGWRAWGALLGPFL